MPRVAMAGPRECAAEQSQDGGARPKVATDTMPKAARQWLYDIIIQVYMALGRAKGNASDSGMYRARAHRY